MKKTIYSCSTLDKCINKACKELGVNEEALNYEIIEEKQGFFMKKTTILVNSEENLSNIEKEKDSIEDNEDEINHNQEIIETEEPISEEDIEVNNGKLKIVKNQIIVTNPKEGGKPAAISPPGDNITVLVDGERIKYRKEVFEENKIEVIFDEVKAHRDLNVKTDNNNMEAYISVIYKPEIKYGLKDVEEKNYLILNSCKIEEKKSSLLY